MNTRITHKALRISAVLLAAQALTACDDGGDHVTEMGTSVEASDLRGLDARHARITRIPALEARLEAQMPELNFQAPEARDARIPDFELHIEDARIDGAHIPPRIEPEAEVTVELLVEPDFGCPSCDLQVVVATGDDVHCAYGGAAEDVPGTIEAELFAPPTPGAYTVEVTVMTLPSCDSALKVLDEADWVPVGKIQVAPSLPERGAPNLRAPAPHRGYAPFATELEPMDL